MLKFFIVTAQQLSIATAVLCALYGLVKVCGLKREQQAFKWAMLLSFVISAVFAAIKHNTRFLYQEHVSIVVLSVIFICALSALICMAIAFLKGSDRCNGKPWPEGRIGGAITFAGIFALSFNTLPSFLLNPTDFVLSNESVFSADFLYCTIGSLGALLMLLLFGLGIYRLSCILSFRLRLIFTGSILLLGILSISGVLLQLLMARRFIPMSSELFAVVRLSVNHPDFITLLLAGLLIIPAAAVFIYYLKLHGSWSNPAQKRILRALSLKNRRSTLFTLIACLLLICDLTVIKSYQNRGFELSPAESFTLKDGVIYIPLTQISDKHLHRFEHKASNGAMVRFIVIQKQGSAFGVGFDACEICGATGYYERDGQVICMLCDVVMNINTIGYKGGCNPIPLAYRIENGQMLIDESALDAQMRRFK